MNGTNQSNRDDRRTRDGFCDGEARTVSARSGAKKDIDGREPAFRRDSGELLLRGTDTTK
jgi:hypothetical protein